MSADKDEFDDELVQWLEERIASSASGVSSPPPSTDRVLSQRQQRLVKCVDALERAWPSRTSGESNAPSIPAWQIPGYEILCAIGRGGMGMVYRARRLSSGDEVALKVLPPAAAADPERLRRFHLEAQIAAQLSNAHVVTVIDVVNTEAGPVLVMPFIDGVDLGHLIEQRRMLRSSKPPNDPHPLAKLSDDEYLNTIWPVLDELIDAAASVHADGILHRDIKPANVLLDKNGEVRLTDFGLARLGHSRQLTMTGQGLGTAGFMSPEQWSGDSDIDERADVFGLAATIYQTLTLELPLGRNQLNIDSPPPAVPSAHQRLLNPDMDIVLLKGLEPNRRHRYRTAAVFRDDWQRVRAGRRPNARRVGTVQRAGRRMRRHAWRVAAIMLVAGLLTTIGMLLWQNWGDNGAASSVAAVPASPFRSVNLGTVPAGARVALIPLDAFNERQPERAVRPAPGDVTPLVLSNVPPGNYLVIAEIPGFGFQEAYRIIPTAGQAHEGIFAHQRWSERDDGSVELPEIRIPSRAIENGMVRFSGGTFTMGPEVDEGPTFHREVARFLLDPNEVTIRRYGESGLAVPRAIAERLEASSPEYDNRPVTGISFDEAVACAELLGKRVPYESEYEFAATMGGTRTFPWGEDAPTGSWTIGPVSGITTDRTPTEPPVFGLFSNAAEWADSEYLPYDIRLSRGPVELPAHLLLGLRSTRVVRGAPPFVVSGIQAQENESDSGSRWESPRCRQRKSRHMNLPTVGFRCARTDAPRWLAPNDSLTRP